MAKVAQATRRRTRRRAVDWSSRCRFEESEHWRGCRFVDASLAGASLELEAPVPECGRIAVELPLGAGGECTPLRGRVRHTRRTESGTVIVGVEFARLTAEQAQRMNQLLSLADRGELRLLR